ncbi:TRAP transporter substrate-binding protein [Pelagibius sp. Alg239-R121]|uniref:TRAP transporter substrate-binding protein n=1 Tax=Pelagibius sp. Alg239-R121 TaxID=2993448 RepID=UPI0024A63999|nr:TRAP transporter substrate-binding protein [Pelagibius sp. Alg239-R121]
MKSMLRLSLAAAIGLCTALPVQAADHKLIISSWAPPSHGLNAIMWPRLIKMIEDATDGRVTAELKLGIAPPPAQMDLVMDGAADLSVIFHGYQAGRFTGTKLIELPGYEGNAEAASVAYWRTHEKYLAALNEHRGVKLIALHTHGPAQLHSREPVKSLESISGLKVRIPGGVGGDVGKALGATGIQVPAPKVYETLASRAADGVVMPFESRKGFKLTEVAQNVFELPGGLYRGSFAFIMNEESFEGLPEDLQTRLKDRVFGEPASRMAGAVWDEIDRAGREATVSTADNSINPASPGDIQAFKKIQADVIARVLAELKEKGVKADAAYAMVKAELTTN